MLFCCRLTRVVLEKRPLNECSVVVVVELVVIAETEDDLIKRLNMWKHNVENRRMRAKKNQGLHMISGARQKLIQTAARWLCVVCDKGVGSNCMQCTSCQSVVV